MIPFRIRIGVTGHRQLSDEVALAARVREALDERLPALFDGESQRILAGLRHTPIAYTVFTSLAEGADRLVAREVLRRPGGRVAAVVPLTATDYRGTFSGPAAIAEFDELIGTGRHAVYLRNRSLGEEFPEGPARDAARQEAYARAGRQVVDSCDVLIALWDGEPARGVGGTAEIVSYAAKLGRPVCRINTADPAFPIEIRAEGVTALNAEAAADIDLFNRAMADQRKWGRAIDEAAGRYLSDAAASGIPAARRALAAERILPACIVASEIAARNQALFQGAGLWAHLLSVAAVAAVATAVLVPPLAAGGYAVELALLAVILALIGYANSQKSRRRWVEHRFLAERLRTAFFFAVCGGEPAPIKVPPHMESFHGPRTWMFRAFEEIRSAFPFAGGLEAGPVAARAAFARSHWVEGQVAYHCSTSARCASRSSAIEHAGVGVFVLAMLAAAVHLLAHGRLNDGIDKTLTAAALLLPAVGAAMDGIRTHRDYSRLARRSGNLGSVLRQLDARFDGVRTEEELEARLREMEEIVALEGQEWFSVMRFVSLEPVP
jgi:hypothetical protein